MVQVANLAVLKTANDGDYIQQTLRGQNIRLYRTGLDGKGNLITRSEVISSISGAQNKPFRWVSGTVESEPSDRFAFSNNANIIIPANAPDGSEIEIHDPLNVGGIINLSQEAKDNGEEFFVNNIRRTDGIALPATTEENRQGEERWFKIIKRSSDKSWYLAKTNDTRIISTISNIQQWNVASVEIGDTVSRSPRPYVITPTSAGQYYLLSELNSGSGGDGLFVWFQNPHPFLSFEVRATGSNRINVDGELVSTAIVPPNSDARFYQFGFIDNPFRYIAHIVSGSRELGVNRRGNPILLRRLNQLGEVNNWIYTLPQAEEGQWFSIIVEPGKTIQLGANGEFETFTSRQHIVTFWSDGQSWYHNAPGMQWEVGERDSGDRFFDGEIIWHQDVRGGALADNASLGITGVDHLLHVTGFARAPSGDEIHPGFFDGGNRIGIYRERTGELRVRTTWPVESYAFHLRYTKMP